MLPKGDLVLVPFGCCDCGLTHVLTLETTPGGRLKITVERNEELTKFARNALASGTLPKVMTPGFVPERLRVAHE